MAGSSEAMDRAEFERLRERHVERIREELQEATALLSQLNNNLSVWGKRTGQTEALSQVWWQFEERLAVVCRLISASEESGRQ